MSSALTFETFPLICLRQEVFVMQPVYMQYTQSFCNLVDPNTRECCWLCSANNLLFARRFRKFIDIGDYAMHQVTAKMPLQVELFCKSFFQLEKKKWKLFSVKCLVRSRDFVNVSSVLSFIEVVFPLSFLHSIKITRLSIFSSCVLLSSRAVLEISFTIDIFKFACR